MEFLYLIYYGPLRLRFLDVETNPGPRRPVPDACRILCSNERGMAENLSDMTMALSRMIYFVFRDFGLRYASRVGVAGFRTRSQCLAVPGQDASGPRDGCICTNEMVTEHFANPNLNVVVAKFWV